MNRRINKKSSNGYLPIFRKSVAASITSWPEYNDTYVNPFCSKLQIGYLDYLKIYVLTIFIVPFRLIGLAITIFLAWAVSCIGLCGYTLEQLNEKPLTGWRKNLQKACEFFMRLAFACGSFHWIKMIGKRATSEEAPILVVAPHSSFVDAIIVSVLGPPAIVAKQATASIPFIGKIITFSQPIYVQREDPNSRQNTVREITNRANSGGKWPQIAIFSEGTCTNRKALIKFKAGAFYAGVPVQPVLLKYPNKYDVITWTWDGQKAIHVLWLILAQFYTNCEMEFLPVYVPNEEEKNDANLYAHNVRAVMAEALGVPTVEYSFEDVFMMDRARNMSIPFSGEILQIERILFDMDLLDTESLTSVIKKFHHVESRFKMDFWTFAAFLKVDVKDPDIHTLFHILDKNHAGHINLRHFLLCGIFCEYKSQETMVMLKAIKDLYVRKCQYISCHDFERIVMHSEDLKKKDIGTLFRAIDDSNRNRITFEEFENYVKDRPQYKFLYKNHPHLRRNFKRE